MKKIVFNNYELRNRKLNFNVFCLMQLDAEEQEDKLEICMRNMKSFRYGLKLGRKDIYNIFDECGYIRQVSTTLRRKEKCINGVFVRYTYLSFSFRKRTILEINEEKLLKVISLNNPKLYVYLLIKARNREKVITKKECFVLK